MDDPRSPFRRDHDRLIHSPAFRRLQGKTQLYPGLESDFFRNRLTHSLEVAQIAKSIAIGINRQIEKEHAGFEIDPDICEFAGLAHDLGHPPFGHQGEEALNECMRAYGGFEGNAQTLRILARLEKKEFDLALKLQKDIEFRRGLNLTFRSLASILKYDNQIPEFQEDSEFEAKPIKGYYHCDSDLVQNIKANVAGHEFSQIFKTIECQIMDIADDIAYSTYDLEDGLKASFYQPTLFFCYPESLFENVASKVTKAVNKQRKLLGQEELSETEEVTADFVRTSLFTIFSQIYDFSQFDFTAISVGRETYLGIEKNSSATNLSNIVNKIVLSSKNLVEDGYVRTRFTSELINQAVRGINFIFDEKFPALSRVYLKEEILVKVEILKSFTYESQILSPRLKVAEYQGQEIVKEIFEVLTNTKKNGWQLMPVDHQMLYKHFEDAPSKFRCICDFIAGMTDKYAIEFYGRLKSENPETIFKPF